MNPIEPESAKWDKRYRAISDTSAAPARVLVENQHLLPATGAALDLASGLGGSALLLAELGLETHAWDISKVACAHLESTSQRVGAKIIVETRDVEQSPPEPQSFDVIVVRFYLNRNIVPALIAALRPGGLLFYETFTSLRVTDDGPENPDYLLKEGELLRLFDGLLTRFYREESILGDTSQGVRNIAQLIAEKPPVN